MKQPSGARKALLRTMAFLLTVVLLCLLLSQVLLLNNETDARHILGFYLEPKDSLDVVMLGASELYTGFCEPLAWRQSGFTSYALAVSAVSGQLYGSMLKEALRRQAPKVLVVEINGFLYDEQPLEESTLRKWIDNIPLSRNKIDTIHALVPQTLQKSFFWPMEKYHENWKTPLACLEMTRQRLSLMLHGGSRTKPFYTRTCAVAPDTEVQCKAYQLSAASEQTLRAFCALCQEQGLENVLFMRMPHRSVAMDADVLFQKCGDVVAEYGFDFANFDKAFEEIGLDQNADFFDGDHMNVFGMEKYTAFFGQYLCDRYGLSAQHSEKVSSAWDACANYTAKLLSSCEDKTTHSTGETITEFRIDKS